MKINLLLSASLLLIASAARVSADLTLKANPNPVIVPAGQTQGKTTLTWNTEGPLVYEWFHEDWSSDYLGRCSPDFHRAAVEDHEPLAGTTPRQGVKLGTDYEFQVFRCKLSQDGKSVEDRDSMCRDSRNGSSCQAARQPSAAWIPDPYFNLHSNS